MKNLKQNRHNEHMNTVKKWITGTKNWFSKLSWKKKALFILVILAAVFFMYRSVAPKKSQYETAKVTVGTVASIVSETGNAQAAASFNVYSPTTGYITDVYVKNGDTVETNTPLFKVQSTATEQEKDSALASLLQAQSALGTAQATMFSLQSSMFSSWDKYYQLSTNSKYQNSDGSPNTTNRVLPEFTTAQTTWLATEAQYKNQQTIVNQTQATLSSASLSYNATQNAVVKAPAPGTIANMTATTGQKVTAQNATTPSLTANIPELIVGDLSHNLVQISLNEVDVNSVKVGQMVNLVFDANRNKTYTGTVQRIDAVGNNTNGVITYNTYISIDNPDSLIKPGMTVTASIETSRHENVLTVPNNAIKPYQGAKAVLIPGAGKDKVNGKTLPFHYVPVTIGIKGTTETEITNGVTDGQTVVTNTNTLLQSGQ